MGTFPYVRRCIWIGVLIVIVPNVTVFVHPGLHQIPVIDNFPGTSKPFIHSTEVDSSDGSFLELVSVQEC